MQVEALRRNKWLRASATYRFSADTFLGDFFFSLGNDLSCSNPSLSKSCRIAILASCSISLNVSLILRNTEKKCSLDLVLTLIMSGKSSVAFFSSWVISTQRITNFAEQKQTEKKIQYQKISILKSIYHLPLPIKCIQQKIYWILKSWGGSINRPNLYKQITITWQTVGKRV